MMSCDNYHVSYLQILESERHLKVSSILEQFSSLSDSSNYSVHKFIQYFSSKEHVKVDLTAQ